MQTEKSNVAARLFLRERSIETFVHVGTRSRGNRQSSQKIIILFASNIVPKLSSQEKNADHNRLARLLSIQRSFRFRLWRVQRRLQGSTLSERSAATFGFIHRFVQSVQRI